MNYRILALFISSMGIVTGFSATANAQFADDTSVGGISIAGLNQTEATRRLTRELAPKLDYKVTLAAGTKTTVRKRRDLGFSLVIEKMLSEAANNTNVPVAFSVDRIAAKNALTRLQNELSTGVVNAKPIYFDGKVQIQPSIAGKTLDFSTSAARLQILGERTATMTRFALEAKTAEPKVKTEDLNGIDSVLETYTTRFNPAVKGRTHNVRLAAAAIDGTVLGADKIFSLNGTVGKRSKARGYKEAIIFESGREIRGLGGGVSQVTGTLFNAALKAGLPIVTYRTHSKPVTYISIGRDATVAWGSFDMKFKNDTGAPIYISYKIIGTRRLRATLFGKKTGRTTKISVTSKRNGPRNISANLYRVIYKNGEFQKREKVGSSHYNWKADNEE
jgi:vancomycin resistance protein YoaR